MRRAVLALLALALVLAVLRGGYSSVPAGMREPPPQPPPIPRSVIDEQDRVDDVHRRRESRFFDDRPLLTALPLAAHGVRLDLAGVDGDARTVVLRISPGRRSRSFARHVYREALSAHGDSGADYRLRWER